MTMHRALIGVLLTACLLAGGGATAGNDRTVIAASVERLGPIGFEAEAVAKPAYEGPANVPTAAARLQGGDDIASATVIPSLPYNDAGLTTGYTDDYDEECPYTGSTSPDVVYKYTPPSDVTVDIELCNSAYDTKLFVYVNGTSIVVDCNDDACGSDGFKSQILGLELKAGQVYYFVIDGWNGNHGFYELSIAESSGCHGRWGNTSSSYISGYLGAEPIRFAAYQDPIANGCAPAYPYRVTSVKWVLVNPTASPVTLSGIHVQIYDVDHSTPGCPTPGTLRVATSNSYEVTVPAGEGVLATFPVISANSEYWNCVPGPYFIALNCPDPVPDLTIAPAVAASPGTSCAAWAYFETGSGFDWHDLSVYGGGNGDIRLWSEGISLEDNNACDCVTGSTRFPSDNALNQPDSGTVGLTFTTFTVGYEDQSLKVRGSSSAPQATTPGTGEGNTVSIPQSHPFFPGEVVTATATNRIQCLGTGGPFLLNGRSWQFTVGVNPTSPGVFEQSSTYSVGRSPGSVAAADLDGDGDLDLVSTNEVDHDLSVRMNNGNGSFTAETRYSVVTNPKSVTVADVDGDGNLDLVSCSRGDSVSVLKNNGGGSFTTATSFFAGDDPFELVTGDLDGDGDVDLAVADYDPQRVSVLKNHGDGTFSAPTFYAFGSPPISITAADLDGDGDLDLAVASSVFDYIGVFENNGDGSFASGDILPVGSEPHSVVAADLDGDGDLDLASACLASDSVSVLKNSGGGTFAAEVGYEAGNSPLSVAAADFDGDGDLDLANTCLFNDSVAVIENNGNGTFAASVRYAVGEWPVRITAGDLDSDGDMDLVAANQRSDDLTVLFNSAGCCEGRTGNVDVAGTFPTDVDSSDLGDLVNFLFSVPGTVTLPCEDEADVNAQGGPNPVDSSDLGLLVQYLFANPPGSVTLPDCP